jgi:hypothetical protein
MVTAPSTSSVGLAIGGAGGGKRAKGVVREWVV